MKTTVHTGGKWIRQLAAAPFLAAALVLASCGDPGVGSSGISLAASCATIDLGFAIPGDGDPNTKNEVILLPAGYLFGRAFVVATKPNGVQRTTFANNTILDRYGNVTNVPAAGAPIYLSSLIAIDDSPNPGGAFLMANVVGLAPETLPTVFFTDDAGRLEVDIRLAEDIFIGDGFSTDVALQFQSSLGIASASCDLTMTGTIVNDG